jgi:hypothetical protein
MNSIKFENKISFISGYKKELDTICDGLVDIYKTTQSPKAKKVGGLLYVIQYKDLENWSVDDNLLQNKSKNLVALVSKLTHMIEKGDACNIKPMLMRMVYKGIKKQTKPATKNPIFKRSDAEFLGHGHFRWNHGGCYTLTKSELECVKTFFEL